MKLFITKPFKFAHGGYLVAEYAPGQEVETDDQELIAVVQAEDWATLDKGSAPENKDAAPKRKAKAAQ